MKKNNIGFFAFLIKDALREENADRNRNFTSERTR